MAIEFELIELRLVTSTQMGIMSELIELRLVTSTQMPIMSELVKLTLVTSTQMPFSVELIANFYLAFVNLISIKKHKKDKASFLCFYIFIWS